MTWEVPSHFPKVTSLELSSLVHRTLSGGAPDSPVHQTRAHFGCCQRFDPGGVPGPTSKLSLHVPAQMGQRETETQGGKQ
jgi:hypothetical protein